MATENTTGSGSHVVATEEHGGHTTPSAWGGHEEERYGENRQWENTTPSSHGGHDGRYGWRVRGGGLQTLAAVLQAAVATAVTMEVFLLPHEGSL